MLREILRLSDGGQVALDWRDAEGSVGTVLVLPGLTGGAHADYVRCVCAAARALRLTAVVFSNRGLGGVPLTVTIHYTILYYTILPARRGLRALRVRGGVPLTVTILNYSYTILAQTPRLYSAVSHDDLAQVVEAVLQRAPAGPLLAVGVSLGGLILGNYLAEWGPRARVAAALVVSSPLDVIRGTLLLVRV